MLSRFNIENEEIFPVCVMATMSSGKSTFINAILGEEILPEKNEACTAQVISILNNNECKIPKAYVIKADGTCGYVEINNKTVMEKINADEKVSEILLETNIQTINNITQHLVIFDTPGVNNSADIRHSERTQSILKQLKKGVIIYLMNATQLATNDDVLLLQIVSKHIKKNPDVNICFIVNKMDMIDEDKESIENIITEAKTYLKDNGFNDAIIFTLSALSSKILRLKLNEKYMTKSEQRKLVSIYEDYKASEKNMIQYATIYNDKLKNYTINNNKVSKYELIRAIENTGIVEIENQILKFMICSEKTSNSTMKRCNNFKEFEGMYSRKKKTKNFKNFTGKIKWICKKCRQVNGDNNTCINCGKPNVKWYIKK